MSASRAARKLKLSKNSANPPQRPAPTPATIQQHKLAALDALADSLARARGRYVLPREFSFIPAAALENLKLDYSPPNAATHAYEDFLVKLLIDYDRIESDGDPVIREQRKAGVQQVDAELERLDQSKREAFLVALSRSNTSPSKRRDQSSPPHESQESDQVSASTSAKQRKRQNKKKLSSSDQLPLSEESTTPDAEALQSKPLPPLPSPSPRQSAVPNGALSRPPAIPFDPNRPIFRPPV